MGRKIWGMVQGYSKLIIILDSNEYINFLNKKTLFLDKIFKDDKITIYINELIIIEVLRNIKEDSKNEFYKVLFRDNIVIYREKLPFNLFEKYKDLGLKKGDTAIAALCDIAKANYLITENRHFLKNIKLKNFKVINLGDFLKNFI